MSNPIAPPTYSRVVYLAKDPTPGDRQAIADADLVIIGSEVIKDRHAETPRPVTVADMMLALEHRAAEILARHQRHETRAPRYRCNACGNSVPAAIVASSHQVAGTSGPVTVVRPVEVLCTGHEHPPYAMLREEG